ncbi:MAG: Undecaprenyl-phosphate 4-deoxy-4-formamido-L-arabinose transferase [Alphaproteobacteria bacterium MarineAlpha5_Bin11]|nr:hypothetical protein [Pelagibacteraceae bacterium]PPR44277.1 MAG: Undecaprenyl-phosphate 4-deoxy-4-formamido-L-arabinose transferase [Alphaproteobacteria bacterium MarineAlpha5_Bin11]|tara:strand:- start:7820 stop:8758 length:939 start_codon:yes stop_codon:yes gene_type:complete
MLSVIVPVYNEEENLEEFHRRLLEVCSLLKEEYEIIYVDDGSNDKSIEIIKNFVESNSHTLYISLYRNFGQHASVMAGFSQAQGNIIMTLDADLQNPPEEIPKFIEKSNSGFDVIAGRRINRKDSISRKILSNFMNKIISFMTGVKLHDYGCMMRLYSRPIIDQLLKFGEKSVYIPAFTTWLSKKTLEIDINHDKRQKGKTKYSLLKLMRQAFDLITAYTLVPIQLIGLFGFFLFLLGIFLFFYLMYFRIFVGSPSSLTSFIAILIFLSGSILFALGIISEYLVRLYKEVRKMPLYVIRESSFDLNDKRNSK